jgi:hypothetical protein
VDPAKLLHFLLKHIYPYLIEDVCAVKDCKHVWVERGVRVQFLDTDPLLAIGDWLIVGESKHKI